MLLAHRVSYEMTRGKILPGLTIDHLCRASLCVNPDHLEAVTMRTNLLRGNGWSGRHARKTHCPRGHSYDMISVRGARGCRRCNVRHSIETKRRKKNRATA